MNKEKLIELQKALLIEEEINTDIMAKQELFDKENKELFEKRINIREVISDCKDILRENAEAGYNKDGEKKRLGGVGIRVLKTVTYDPSEALKWAKEHSLALSLDKRRFEQLAKTEEIDFVTLGEKVTVTFPKTIILEE